MRGDSSTGTNPKKIIGGFQSPSRNVQLWSSNQEDNAEPKNSEQENYDSLYEFLTRRTGEAAGETERRRKRDRIREWMGSGSSSTTKRSTHMVQPIRMEDGTIMNDDEPPRTQARFETLFSGMPSLNEILSREDESGDADDAAGPTQEATITAAPARASKIFYDDSWFDEEKKQIEGEYDQILEDMKSQIDQQGRDDPDSVPANAKGVVESVVNQELERMLTSVKTTRAKERLQDYEISKKSRLDSGDLSYATDKVAKEILKQAAKDWERTEALKAQVDSFSQYEQDAVQRAESANVPLPGSDLDSWALGRLENMLDTSQKRADDEGAVSDILEQNIDDLRGRIEKESMKGEVEPKTMKEWQMYRSISTRLKKAKSEENPDAESTLNQEDLFEQQITEQLNSWREYIGKEEETRKRSGLAAGPKMPFDWQVAKKDKDQPRPPPGAKNKTRREIRREVNIQAIKALEDLVLKSDSVRAEKLQKQLDALKAELEPRDYNDIEEAVAEVESEPIDLRAMFSRRDDSEKVSTQPPNVYEAEKDGIDQMLDGPDQLESSGVSYDQKNIQQAPPSSPFFSDDFDRGVKSPPPSSPFFSDESDSTITEEKVDVKNSKLGTVEEQKLRKMYRKAGARTTEEKDAIRAEWESFQSLEKAMREQSGLSDGDDSSLIEKVGLNYDISEVMKEDGDFDAEKILATIGPRPTRKKSSTSSSTKPVSTESSSETQPFEDPALRSNLDPTEVSDSLYRSMSAVGGGRTKDDPTKRDEEKAGFDSYLKKSDEMRRSLDTLDKNAEEMAKLSDVRVDDPSYAQDVLASIGPRPTFKKKGKQVVDEKEFSDLGSALASDDDSDNEASMDDDSTSSLDFMPAWLKKERESMKNKDGYDDGVDLGLSGRNLDEVFDNDQYEHNLRQLHEYEERRSGHQKQMGIDISDVLGRRGTDDYADYTYDTDYFRGRQDGWGSASFEARKSRLLEYVELNLGEVNHLMDHRDSTYTTGVSQYLPRINKPFKEFGAIFRLEGALIDITGLNKEVWAKVATEFDFQQPLEDDVRRAAVNKPEVAIREVFYWTNDIMLVQKGVSAYRRIFREAFDQWADDQGLSATSSAEKGGDDWGAMALGADLFPESEIASVPATKASSHPQNEQSRLKHLKEAWFFVAQEFVFPEPTNEQIAQSSFLPPDIAVRDILRWSSNQLEIENIVSAFSQYSTGSRASGSASAEAPPTRAQALVMDENALLELQYLTWIQIAEEYSFEAPTPEEALAAAVLNDPEVVIVKGFGWTEDKSQVHDLAQKFRDYLAKIVNERLHGRSYEAPAAVLDVARVEEVEPMLSGPTEEEVLQAQVQAWNEVARVHGFQAPPADQIQLTMNLSASDAVRQLLGWTYNFNNDQIVAISSSYEEALKSSSQKYFTQYNMKIETVNVPTRSQKVTEPNADELYQAVFDAWTNVALQSGFAVPDQEQVQFAMAVGPVEAILVGFQWTEDLTEARAFEEKYLEQIKLKRAEWHKNGLSTSASSQSEAMSEEAIPFAVVRSGVDKWIKSLEDVEMGCGVASYLEEDQVNALLRYAGLSDLFPPGKRVSQSNGYDRGSQQMLGVALRMERRPDHCVVFDTSPYANTAAQEVEMRTVSLVGPYPRYELLSADTSSDSLDDLTAMNIRRLFGERVYDQPMLDMMQSEPEIVRKTKTAFWDTDE